MLTFFTCPKPFNDPHIRMIQRNAIQSWVQLEPRPEILLMGTDEGVRETAEEFGLRHIPDIQKNEYGTPLVSSIWREAEKETSNDIMAYINADIILSPSFLDAIAVCSRRKRFLAIGRRTDLDVSWPIDFKDSDWWARIQEVATKEGGLHAATGLDYFVFRKGLWQGRIPDFALGRCAWDQWLVAGAWMRGALLVDGTALITAIHQNHGYGVDGARSAEEIWQSREAELNRRLAGGWAFDRNDCQTQLRMRSVTRGYDAEHVARALERMQQWYPMMWEMLLSWKIRALLCRWFGSALYSMKYRALRAQSESPALWRMIGSSYGSFPVLMERLPVRPVVYSFGIGRDASFDIEMIEKANAEVFAFDPTPESIKWVAEQVFPESFHFIAVGVAAFDGTAEFGAVGGGVSHSMVSGSGGAGFRGEVRRLESLLKQYGHNHVDILKLDIEGAEYDVIRDIAGRIDVGQIVVEFHHRLQKLSFLDTYQAIRLLRRAGYEVFYKSHDHEVYGFCKLAKSE